MCIRTEAIGKGVGIGANCNEGIPQENSLVTFPEF